MSHNPHAITRQLESAVAAYTGAPYAVAVTSCTAALMLAVEWHARGPAPMTASLAYSLQESGGPLVVLPRRTYVSVPQAVIRGGGRVAFRGYRWRGAYQLEPLRIWDSARWFTSGLYKKLTKGNGGFACTSHHCTKTMGDTQGGFILHDSAEADVWLRKARFDGRTEGVHPSKDNFTMIGHHCYLSPDVSARLLWKLSVLPKNNKPLKNDKYPDLSKFPIFTGATR